MLILELKKMLKTPLTLILVAVALFMSVLLSYLPVSFEKIQVLSDNTLTVYEGTARISYEKEVAPVHGEITAEIAKEALTAYQECFKKYGVQSEYDLPEGAYEAEISPWFRVLHTIREVYADPQTGIPPDLLYMSVESLDDFYSRRTERFESLMEQEDWPEAVREKARRMYASTNEPMEYHPYYNSNALDYESFLFFIVMICCILIAAPVFSIDYQTGADDIMRCTKNGRIKLAASKCGATLLISTALFTICAAIYCLLTQLFYGAEGMQTDLQMMLSVFTLQNWTVGELLLRTAGAGVLSCVAAVSLTLLLSSRSRSVGIAVGAAILLGILPIVLDILVGGQLIDWVCSIIPSGGICLTKSFYFAVFDMSFLTAKNFAIPTTLGIVLFAVIEIPLFLLLTIKSYQNGLK